MTTMPDASPAPPRCIADIMVLAANRPPIRTAVVHPCDAASLGGAIAAADHGLIDPVLVGPEAKIRAAASAAGLDISRFALVSVEHSHAAADKACRLAREGQVAALMKGSLHTDELLGAVVNRDTGLRTDRRMSHVFIFEVPGYPRLLLVSDAAIIIAPDLNVKRDIVQNAIDCALALGIVKPRVAVLAAVETVHPAMPTTTDAASLAKMAHRGQIVGGIVDGPLAFDNAISPEAVATKHIVSEVAGRADVLIAPNIEAGNMIAKQLTYFSGALSAGIVIGARVPIILTSRADGELTRLASCAAALLVSGHQRLKPPR
jgi:phosphate acetyltransferase